MQRCWKRYPRQRLGLVGSELNVWTISQAVMTSICMDMVHLKALNPVHLRRGLFETDISYYPHCLANARTPCPWRERYCVLFASSWQHVAAWTHAKDLLTISGNAWLTCECPACWLMLLPELAEMQVSLCRHLETRRCGFNARKAQKSHKSV